MHTKHSSQRYSLRQMMIGIGIQPRSNKKSRPGSATIMRFVETCRASKRSRSLACNDITRIHTPSHDFGNTRTMSCREQSSISPVDCRQSSFTPDPTWLGESSPAYSEEVLCMIDITSLTTPNYHLHQYSRSGYESESYRNEMHYSNPPRDHTSPGTYPKRCFTCLLEPQAHTKTATGETFWSVYCHGCRPHAYVALFSNPWDIRNTRGVASQLQSQKTLSENEDDLKRNWQAHCSEEYSFFDYDSSDDESDVGISPS